MKKRISALFIAVFMLLCTVPCYAQTVNSSALGISFTLSDDWKHVSSDDDSIEFQYKTSSQQAVIVEIMSMEYAYSYDLLNMDFIVEICEQYYSDATLAQKLAEINNAPGMTVSTESVVTGTETYNGVLYYRYEKAYTARAYGFRDTAFYETIYVTPKNGRLYFIKYFRRDDNTNHFDDIFNMLTSISYELGEIKIDMNGERIHPDSAPIILNNRTLVPIRAVAENMGYSVEWDGENQLVGVVSADQTSSLIFGIGIASVLVDLEYEIPLDVAPIIVEGRTYLPLRAVAELLGAEVGWDGANRIVSIYY